MILLDGIDKVLEYIPATQAEIKRALRNAVNATASNARKMAIDKIGSQTGLGKELVKEKTRVKGTTQDSMVAEVHATKTRISLEQYKPTIIFRGTRGSVYIDYSMLRGQELIAHRTFSNPAKGKIRRRKGAKAYPIYSPSGPSVSHHWDRISEEIKNKANENLVRLFTEKLEKQIAKR